MINARDAVETNLTSAKLQLDAVIGVDNEAKETAAILTEKGNIAAVMYLG